MLSFSDWSENKANLIMLLLVLSTTLFAYYPGLFAGFELNDDHSFIRLSSDVKVHDQVAKHADFFSEIFTRPASRGRFFPLQVATNYLFAKIFGHDSFIPHVIVLVYALSAGVLLYMAASRIFGSVFVGGLLAIWILQSPDPGPAETWTHIWRHEHIGMVFLSICLYCISHSGSNSRAGAWDWAGFSFFAGASLVKETFFLVAPALIFLRWYLGSSSAFPTINSQRKPFPTIGYIYAIWSMFILSIIVIVVLNSPKGSHGARSIHTNLFTTVRMLVGSGGIIRNMPRQSVWFIPVVGLIMWNLSSRRVKWSNEHFYLTMFTILWVSPQILIYMTRDYMEGRYWLPMIVGLCFINALALRDIVREKIGWKLRYVVLALIFLWMARCLQINWATSVNFTNRTKVLSHMVEVITDNVPDFGAIIIVAPPKTEHAISVVHLLGIYGKPHVKAYLFQPNGSDGDRYCFVGYDNPNILKPEDVDAVVYLTRAKNTNLAEQPWYDSTRFRRSKLTGYQHFFSLKNLSWTSFEYGFELDLASMNYLKNTSIREAVITKDC